MLFILLQLFLLVLGFVLLIKGADWFVDGASGIAGKLGIPQLVIGLTIVAMGTSAPEAAVSITSAFKGTADIAIGNVLGSNIMNVLIILGITACIRNIAVPASTFKYEIPFMTAMSVLLVVLGMWGNAVSRLDAVILWGFFICYWLYLLRMAKNNKEEETETDAGIPKLLVLVVVGAVIIVVGSNLTVNAATELAHVIGISERIIGLTIVAFGTSLPELATSVIAARKGNADIAIGNIVGSNLFNMLFVIGTSGLIIPITYQSQFLVDGVIAVLVCVLLWIAVAKDKVLKRSWGIVMILAYACYFVYLLVK